ncbi:MAG: hypothetical protein QM775_10795 [Pirellulales bacterium]
MIDFLIAFLGQLKDMPGFRFLEPYYHALYSKVQAVQDKRGDLEDKFGGFKQGVDMVRKAPQSYKGSKKRR